MNKTITCVVYDQKLPLITRVHVNFLGCISVTVVGSVAVGAVNRIVWNSNRMGQASCSKGPDCVCIYVYMLKVK